ncbi:hypothetical protein BDR26DRAFT_856341 [Obelidium mucronatum]|nr:hypothetical protein BDR26DRAFT_856341 [Obelidium mucronatum]
MIPETTTAVDYLAEQQSLLEEAAQALPHAIDRCSFDKGPLRQPVFSCLTCSDMTETSEPIGVCYACVVQCHTTHSVVELFHRRNFTCDCGTLCTEGSVKCALQKKSIGVRNDSNVYDQCFSNVFCYCKTKYEYETERENSFMLQCLFCEDWFHDACIKNCPDEDSFDEFACRTCVALHPFLAKYEKLSANMVLLDESDEPANTAPSALLTPGRKKRKSDQSSETPNSGGIPNSIASANESPDESLKSASKRPRQNLELSTSSCPSSIPPSPVHRSISLPSSNASLVCKLDAPVGTMHEELPSSHMFCFEGWRNELCRCPDCLEFYTAKNIDHLLTENQSEPTGSAVLPDHCPSEESIFRPDEDANKSLLESGMDALNKIPRVNAIEGVRAYERFAQFTKDYLKKFADEGRIVTKSDVEAMFQELKAQGSSSQ